MKEQTEEQRKEETRQRNAKREEDERAKKEEQKRREKEQRDKVASAFKRRSELTLWEKYGPYTGYIVLGLLFLFVLLSNFSGDRRKLADIIVNEDSFITKHNEGDASYKLGANPFFQGRTLADLKEIFNNRITIKKNMARCNSKALEQIQLRDSYNFYEEHPKCRTDEKLSYCSSAYAEVPISVFRNKMCMKSSASETAEEFKPSLDFFFRCNKNQSKGCFGGYLVQTLGFMKKGIVSEQCWNEQVGAQVERDIKVLREKKSEKKEDEECPLEKLKTCDKKFVTHHCALEGEEEIKKEIQSNGPVMAFVFPYRDFFVYRSGDYEIEEKSKLEGMIIVKIVGWETLKDGNGVWLVDPLWGREFGVNGLARVRIGQEESFLDKFAYALTVEKTEQKSAASTPPREDDEPAAKEPPVEENVSM